ncbi:MAG: hypothetical protein HN396_08115 [Gemmatimonadales bacterium]|jgi:hypothetical protein|nr:hypothetical protein [Gemmatimonadales bacterium]MBT3499859.1 hypothetical protein [Gemmatimonadales bacterium]MBT3774893.1 hypothetical protein [Gemmatimonadales bacterium]MBT5044320.1 hypothetical protein [Gemmatimonadales bacterium]MBT6695230.1 hypothetical protein [Gemmatimonadales bacterium]
MGSNFKFEFDTRALERVAPDAVKEVARNAQPHFDRLHREHAGNAVGEVEPHVRALFRRLDWKPASPSEIRDYAQVISRGDRIVLEPGRVRI